MVEVQFFQIDIECTATISWKDNLFLIELCCHHYKKWLYTLYMCVGLFLDSLFYSLVYMSVLRPNTTCCWLPQICSKSWSGSVSSPILFSFRIILVVLGPLQSHTNCRIILSISTKTNKETKKLVFWFKLCWIYG